MIFESIVNTQLNSNCIQLAWLWMVPASFAIFSHVALVFLIYMKCLEINYFRKSNIPIGSTTRRVRISMASVVPIHWINTIFKQTIFKIFAKNSDRKSILGGLNKKTAHRPWILQSDYSPLFHTHGAEAEVLCAVASIGKGPGWPGDHWVVEVGDLVEREYNNCLQLPVFWLKKKWRWTILRGAGWRCDHKLQQRKFPWDWRRWVFHRRVVMCRVRGPSRF